MSKPTFRFNQFNTPLDIPKAEEEVLKYWQENRVFQQSIDQRSEDKSFTFYDGPPFATGLPHYGHILASTIKDVIPRYWTMKGYRVERTWGWDCHGLPIENIIEKELKLQNKQAIEDFGIENFNGACRATVMRYADEWKKVINRLGRFVDMEHDYKTMEPWYMESLWWVFKSLFDRDLIYQGYKSMHVCPRCVTPLSNFEVSQGYKEIKDISVIAEFKIKNPEVLKCECNDVRLLAWTTTPWTLPGNVLLALKPDATYVLVKGSEENKCYICAKNTLSFVFGSDTYEIVGEFEAKQLAGLDYEPLMPYHQNTPKAFRTVLADFVTLEEGTGIVHIAPAFGEDDYQVGLAENIPLIQHVDMEGKFKLEVSDFAGLPVKPKDDHVATDVKIIKYLKAKDVLFKKINITHTCPHCWRCDTPLINYATNSWFVKVVKIKDALLANNQKINWVPDHIKNGRFGKWLENARDWAISRNRYWGTPLPVWQASDGSTICVRSIQELEELSGQTVSDLHKEVVDKITFTKDGKKYTRISEVLDCWFESGAMPYASFHYPFENKAKFEKSFPAEFISEGQDQTRGWFYTLHVLATALTYGDNPAIKVGKQTSSFQNCVCSGIVLAEDGKKMSKKLKNYPDPMVVTDKYGVDALRMYLISSPVVKAENLNFSEKEVSDIKRKVFTIFWNVVSFYRLYTNSVLEPQYPEAIEDVLDRWLVSTTESLIKDISVDMDTYDVVSASRKIMEYTDKISTWYIRLSRNRIRQGNAQSSQVLGTVLYRLALIYAPFAPFFSELVYQNLNLKNAKDSIHLEDWPVTSQANIDMTLEEKMDLLKKIVEGLHAIRQKNGIKVKQPLASYSFSCKNVNAFQNFAGILEILEDEVNVKQYLPFDERGLALSRKNTTDFTTVTDKKNGEITVYLDLEITNELRIEGEAREIIRKIQQARKDQGVDLKDRISVELPEWPKNFENEIKQKVLADTLTIGEILKVTKI